MGKCAQCDRYVGGWPWRRVTRRYYGIKLEFCDNTCLSLFDKRVAEENKLRKEKEEKAVREAEEQRWLEEELNTG